MVEVTGKQNMQELLKQLIKQPKHEALTVLVLLLLCVICCNKVRVSGLCMHVFT